MKKKPAKRKAIGGLVGAVAEKTGNIPLGIIPQMLYKNYKDNKATPTTEPQSTPSTMPSGPMQRPQRPAKGMRKGGKIDGCAMRGKTKGRVT